MAVDHKAHNLVEAIRAVGGERLLRRITDGLKEPTRGTTPRRKAEWAREIVARMDAMLLSDQCREIMGRCSCHIRPEGIRKERKLWQQCASVEDFARAKRERGWMDDGFLAEGDTLRIKISNGRCHCGLVRSPASAHRSRGVLNLPGFDANPSAHFGQEAHRQGPAYPDLRTIHNLCIHAITVHIEERGAAQSRLLPDSLPKRLTATRPRAIESAHRGRVPAEGDSPQNGKLGV